MASGSSVSIDELMMLMQENPRPEQLQEALTDMVTARRMKHRKAMRQAMGEERMELAKERRAASFPQGRDQMMRRGGF